MSVERNNDGSITIKSSNGVTAIGRIVGTSDDRHEEKFKQWVEDCAKLVTACDHTLRETEDFFLKQCDALPLIKDDMRMKNFLLNVIMNHCKDKLEHQAAEFSFDMTDEEIEQWDKEDKAMRQEAINTPPEKFGLNVRGYYLPHTENNKVFYEQAYHELQERMKNIDLKQIQMQDICFFFEETTGHFQSSGGGNELMKKMIVFRGVCENDIKKRNPQFLGYITTLRDIGNLPGIIEEK